MSVGRNEPCPCGSEKKYKKCCMNKITSITYSDEDIQYIQGQSFHLMMKHDPESFKDYMTEKLDPVVLDHLQDESQEQLFTLLVFGHYLLQKQNGVLEQLMKESVWSVKQRHLLKTWKDSGVFSLFSIQEWEGEKMLVTDMARDDSYHVVLPVGFPSGPAGMGFLGLVPVQGKWYPFGVPYMVATEPSSDKHEKEKFDIFKEAFAMTARETSQTIEDPSDIFPAILNIYYLFLKQEEDIQGGQITEVDTETWTKEEQEVLDLLSQKVEKELSDDRSIEAAKRAWEHYCALASPVIRKPEVFAAALEYYLSKHYQFLPHITQKKISEKYGVSATTVSKRAQSIQVILN